MGTGVTGQSPLSPARTPRPGAALIASAGVTVAAAVGLDTMAGDTPLHTAALGAVALMVGLVRLRYAGQGRRVFAALSLTVLAQPAAHAAATVVDLGAPAEEPHLGASSVDLSSVVVHVLFALVALAVSASEPAFEVLAVSWARLVRLLAALLDRSTPPHAAAVSAVARTRAVGSAEYRPFACRRGPPPVGRLIG